MGWMSMQWNKGKNNEKENDEERMREQITKAQLMYNVR